MKIINITESGSNNILRWAISNNANILKDEALKHIIDDKIIYKITYDDVNFLELFRLTQLYRDEIRIKSTSILSPEMIKFSNLFSGSIPNKTEGSESTTLASIAEHSCKQFHHIALQMSSDNDIINSNAQALFVPMILRSYQVEVPIHFIDFIRPMTDDEAKSLFTNEYPETLHDIVDNDHHHVNIALMTSFIPSTAILKYDKRYEQYIKAIMYSPLKTVNTNKIYKINLLSFRKYNKITRSDIICELFMANDNKMTNDMNQLSKLNTPLKLDFIVQLPIYYMQLLENFFSYEDLPIMYESSMSDIIDGGLSYDDFITPNIDPATEDPEEIKTLENFNNQISAYKVRIAEANQVLINTISILLKSSSDINSTDIFSLIPSVYTTKAVISIDLSKIDKYRSIPNSVIVEMFDDMINISNHVLLDINKSK